MATSVTWAVPARVGLVGNPSDGHGGAVVAAPFPQRAATATVRPADEVVIAGPGVEHRWPTLDAFLDSVGTAGHPVSQRILTASLRIAVEHVGERVAGRVRSVRLDWATTVPRSVGLAGSSALAVAAIGALAETWGMPMDRRVMAALALRAEVDELGIAAGWQDRIVQSVGAPVLVDVTATEVCDGLVVPRVRHLQPPRALPIVVGWLDSAASGSGTYHAAVRERAASLTTPMAQLGELARAAADTVDAGDVGRLAELVDATWRLRQSAAPLRADHAALVEAVRATGVAATTPGSGGAVVAVPTDADAMSAATAALAEQGAQWCTSELRAPPD
jgi:glucuronokinase